jgi:hypothetical protein
VIEAARAFDVQFLILDANTPLPLQPIYQAKTVSSLLILLQETDGFQLYQIYDQ